jgi:hypothetical protein
VSELVRARVEDHLVRLRMRHVAERIDAMLSEAARAEPTYLDFLDGRPYCLRQFPLHPAASLTDVQLILIRIRLVSSQKIPCPPGLPKSTAL